MSSRQNAPSRRRIVRDVPIVRQAGLNIAGHSSTDQLGCTSETPESMDTPELPPHIHYHPIFSHDGYSSMPPNYQDDVPLPRELHLTRTAPHASGPDRVHQMFEPSRFRMVYTYMPLRGAEKSRQEYTDGVVYRDVTTGIQKTTARRFHLPPLRPPRESLATNLEITPIATTSTSTPRSSVSARTVREHAPATVPVVDKAQSKIIVKDAKEYVITETLNTCGFHDSSSRLTVVRTALSSACLSVITEDHSIELWINENLSMLYKTVITPMSTILNRFKHCAQDLVGNLYRLQMSIWTDPAVQANHNKSTVDFFISNNSLNYIFGDPLEDGREVRYPFEHEGIIQIADRAAFCDGYDKFIYSDSSLDNIMAMSATAACCSLQEFATGVFKQIDFTYASFHAIYTKLINFIRVNIRSNPALLARWNRLFQLLRAGAR
ncbi:hypothetical protein DFJ58DRAFT_723500 [Suillus subalutaceus]|uniref:uncharacterized protein n=1 Tax=Suillus subalutaceus TaxID=48586 RepID=UPI001B886DA4|nr:uncharacterized protein DFJ58DRAFT_723500 [Suillus subalutaceus]KAG1868250.1 hypothetical protein DFJ58DRAFT_723500 [Suillus subalutaceus]